MVSTADRSLVTLPSAIAFCARIGDKLIGFSLR